MPEFVDLIRDLAIPGYGDDEVAFFERAVVLVEPIFIGEWGTNVGSSARIFSELVTKYGLRSEIVTVDLPRSLSPLDRDHAGQRGRTHSNGAAHVTHLTGDGVTEALFEYVEANSPRKAVFFLDGNHQKENVYRELVSLHRLAPKAVLLLHDTHSEPGEAVELFLDRHPGSYQVAKLASQAGMIRLWPNG